MGDDYPICHVCGLAHAVPAEGRYPECFGLAFDRGARPTWRLVEPHLAELARLRAEVGRLTRGLAFTVAACDQARAQRDKLGTERDAAIQVAAEWLQVAERDPNGVRPAVSDDDAAERVRIEVANLVAAADVETLRAALAGLDAAPDTTDEVYADGYDELIEPSDGAAHGEGEGR